jgi:RNA polymerase sigma-70 factor, ECF subfamily
VNRTGADWSELMRAAIGGDATAYDRLLRELSAALRGRVRRVLKSSGHGGADPEDIVQEVLLAIHLKRHTWRTDEPIGPWIAAIARYKTVDAMRKRGWRVHVPIDDFADTLAAEEPEHRGSSRDVERSLGRLPPSQRCVVEAIAIEGLSIGETAARLDVTEGAVRVALHRGLTALAKTHQG